MLWTPSIRTLSLSFAAALFFVTPTTAQSDDLLVVEKRKDLAARTRVLSYLQSRRVTINFEDATVSDFVEYLHAVTGKAINVIVATKTKKADLPKVTLSLKGISLANLMSIYEEKSGLRFAFRSGAIFLKQKAEVKEFAYLRMYDVRAAVAMVPVFLPPKLGLRDPNSEQNFRGGVADEKVPIRGYDGDKLVEMVRGNAAVKNWDEDGISLEILNGTILCRQTVKGQRAVEEILVKLGAIQAPRRVVAKRRRAAAKLSKRSKKKRAAKKPVAKKPATGKKK